MSITNILVAEIDRLTHDIKVLREAQEILNRQANKPVGNIDNYAHNITAAPPQPLGGVEITAAPAPAPVLPTAPKKVGQPAGITLAEAAARLGLSKNRIASMVTQGKLQRASRGTVTVESVEQHLAKKADPSEQSGLLSVAQAATIMGVDKQKIYNLRHSKQLESGGVAMVTRASVEAYMERRAGGAAPKPMPVVTHLSMDPNASPEVVAAVREMVQKAATYVPQPAPGVWTPRPSHGDRMVSIDKIAPQLGMNTSQLEEVKRNGRIPGGNGWINLTLLEQYMAHADYEPPFATE